MELIEKDNQIQQYKEAASKAEEKLKNEEN
jgi:hypothetical protein